METLRLDVWLDVACLFRTRSEAQKACKIGRVDVNGQTAKPHREVLYEDRTPKPTEDEIQMRRLTRLARAFAPPPVTPDKRERRRLRRLKEGDEEDDR